MTSDRARVLHVAGAFSLAVVALWSVVVLREPALGWTVVPATMVLLARVAGMRACLVALVLSPSAWAFAKGVVDHRRGDAVLLDYGPVGSRVIDPATRAYLGSRGCMRSGTEWIKDEPHNLGIVAATAIFGIAPGLYDGPLPSQDEVPSLVRRDSRILSRTELVSDRIAVADGAVNLVPGTGRLLERWIDADEALGTQPRDLRVALVGRRLLLLSYVSGNVSIVLGIDRRTARLVFRDFDSRQGAYVFCELPPVRARYAVVELVESGESLRAEVHGFPRCSFTETDESAAIRRIGERVGGQCDLDVLGEPVILR